MNYLEVGTKVVAIDGIKDDGCKVGLQVGVKDGVIDVGSKEGTEEGVKVGAIDVGIVGARDGGTFDGITEGDNVGAEVGINEDGDAVSVGNSVGLSDCVTVGSSDGDKVGIIVGLSDDNADGEYDEGIIVGIRVGLCEGCRKIMLESAAHTKANTIKIVRFEILILVVYSSWIITITYI
jgi:hypothetical protein